MAITGIKNTKMMLIIKPFSSVQGLVVGRNCMSRLARPNHRKYADKVPAMAAADEGVEDAPAASCWVPHPRTGIYFPKGQEWVMDDIPNDAASFDCTFWFRSIDGVDHKSDTHHDDHYLHYYRN